MHSWQGHEVILSRATERLPRYRKCQCLHIHRRDAHGPLAKHLMHMVHLSGNASRVSKSSSDWLDYTGFLGDVCVASFNVPPGNDAVAPIAVVFTTVTADAYQDQLNAGFSKVCEIFKVRGIESLK